MTIPEKRSNTKTAGMFALIGLLAFALGCPRTDSDTYEEWESGESTLKNTLGRSTLWLGGCNPFQQQRLLNGEWIDQGGEIACLWEGLASPLAPGEVRVDSFTARTQGTWRLNYPIGRGCRPDQPMSKANCRSVSEHVSNEFEVVMAIEDDVLCEESGGRWDLGSCGDYFCGTEPLCLAVIPGCDCGPTANFVSGEGCVEDVACDASLIGEQALCESTGGYWDALSCGHYSCGNRPDCTAVVPGCDCGPTSVFDEVLGCLAVPCGARQDS